MMNAAGLDMREPYHWSAIRAHDPGVSSPPEAGREALNDRNRAYPFRSRDGETVSGSSRLTSTWFDGLLRVGNRNPQIPVTLTQEHGSQPQRTRHLIRHRVGLDGRLSEKGSSYVSPGCS